VTIAPGSTLDITNNTLNINYGSGSSPLAAVENAVAYGAGVATATSANGAIISSTASGGPTGKYAVGYADAAEDANVPAGNVAIMYTLAGDNTLGGSVTFQDYSILQNNYNKPGVKDWYQGDYNHDGTVNFQDYSMLQNNYGKPGVPVASPLLQTALTTRTTRSAVAALSLASAGASPALAHSVAPAVATPTITYLLSVNDNGSGGYAAGEFAVYATDSATANGTNYGIASYGFTLANATTVTNYGPQAQYFDESKGKVQSIGFTVDSSAANAANVTGSQDTVDYAQGSDVVLVDGIGQTGGNLANDASVPNFALGAGTQTAYGAPVELANGTFSGLAPSFTSNSTAVGNYFDNPTSGSNPYFTDAASLVFETQTLGTPEPATLGLLGLGGVMMMRRRRSGAKK
jgi:hypothetical protein